MIPHGTSKLESHKHKSYSFICFWKTLHLQKIQIKGDKTNWWFQHQHVKNNDVEAFSTTIVRSIPSTSFAFSTKMSIISKPYQNFNEMWINNNERAVWRLRNDSLTYTCFLSFASFITQHPNWITHVTHLPYKILTR